MTRAAAQLLTALVDLVKAIAEGARGRTFSLLARGLEGEERARAITCKTDLVRTAIEGCSGTSHPTHRTQDQLM